MRMTFQRVIVVTTATAAIVLLGVLAMTGSPQGSPSSPPPDAPGDSAAQNANAAPAPAADNALPADSAGESADEHEAALKNPDGSWKYTNDLIKESSPYLLQHAHNPVQWHAWGKEAFELARKTGKPIFLSIGYSTCYWCHVMERQCFENPEIAKQMNEQFVCIKVDREERPDVDDIYMAATQALTGGGGWPMSVFLTPPGAKGPTDPGLKPFFAGTFFPAVPQNGMPAFGQLMTHLTNIWTNERNRALEASDALSAHVQQLLSRVERGGRLDAGMVRQAANQLMRSYDPEDGGFGRGRNKFPTPNNLLFLIRVHQNNPDDDLWEALSYTLERMARGGIYDHVGGGFHRYATDTRWLVPHFEKMLYDNGQLVEAYLVAQSVKPDAKDPTLYQRVARQTCQYVLREMTDPTGTFWSAQDAEVDAREGGNYIWTPDEVRAALADRELATLALKMYGLDRGTNFQDPHHPQAPAANVIHLPLRLDELAADQGVTLAELLKKQQQINQQLYAVRMKRKQPRTDDKVLVSWNGLMIGGLAMAGRQLNEPRFTQAAARAAGYILDHMRTPDGGLYRAMRNGKPRIDAFLDDYAFFVHGLIELHRADHDQRWLDAAEALTAAAAKRFAHPDGGYYDTLAEQADLFVRTRGTYDGAIPTGNSQMVHDLLDLHALTNNAAYLDRAILDLQSFAAALDSQGATMAHMQHALLRALEAAPAKVAAAAQPQPQPAPAGADQPQPLTVAVDPPRLDLSTGSATLKVSVTIAPGYHINATDPGDKLLIPTKLSLEEAKGLELTVDYPKGQSKKYAFADQPLNVYEGAIVLQVTIRKASDDAANARPVLVLRYQACTDKACLKPKDLEVPVVFEGLK